MQSWYDLLEDVLVECEGVPSALAERACIRAARQLCAHAPVLRDTVTHHVAADTRVYEFVLMPEHDAVVVLNAWFDGRPMRPLVERETWAAGSEAPYRYQAMGERVVLLWTPDKAISDGLVVRFSLQPSFLSERGDDVFFGEYREAVIAGALAHLMMMVGREWSNEKMGLLHAAAFSGHVNQANGMWNKRGTRADTQVRMRPFAAGTSRR